MGVIRILPFSWLLLTPFLCIASPNKNEAIIRKSSVNKLDKEAIDEITWEEEIPPHIILRKPTEWDVESKSERIFLTWKSMEDLRLSYSPIRTLRKKAHPLRTNLWRIRFRSRRDILQLPFEKTILVEFHPSGYCRLTKDDNTENLKKDESNNLESTVGTWNIIPSGVLWELPTLEFWAEVHHQPFANHPRMLRGIVVRRYSRYVMIRRIMCILQ
jgi:hypothetical protein